MTNQLSIILLRTCCIAVILGVDGFLYFAKWRVVWAISWFSPWFLLIISFRWWGITHFGLLVLHYWSLKPSRSLAGSSPRNIVIRPCSTTRLGPLPTGQCGEDLLIRSAIVIAGVAKYIGWYEDVLARRSLVIIGWGHSYVIRWLCTRMSTYFLIFHLVVHIVILTNIVAHLWATKLILYATHRITYVLI